MLKQKLFFIGSLFVIAVVFLKLWYSPDWFFWIATPYSLIWILYFFRNKIKVKKSKTKEWFTLAEFMGQWRKGMQQVTPLQQTITIQFGQIVSLIGVVWGIIFSIRLEYWWMAIILVGGLIILGVQMLGNWQKKLILKQMENLINATNINFMEEKQ